MELLTVEEAAQLLPSAERILVFGCSGSGKSTLSKRLAKRIGLRYISMDKEYFLKAGWIKRDRAEISELIGRDIQDERWLMDGTNSSTFDLRLPRTHLAIWMRPSRYRSLLGVYGRVLRSYGKVRPEMAEGCPERFPDRAFLSYIWNFETVFAPKIDAMLAAYGQNVPVLVLKSRRETARLLALLDARS